MALKISLYGNPTVVCGHRDIYTKDSGEILDFVIGIS
jgi:hypothetical protein